MLSSIPTHCLCLHPNYNHLIKVSSCFLSKAGYFICKSAGVYTRNAPSHCTGGCGCCRCNPQDAEQNPSWDFTPPSLTSSFPHLFSCYCLFFFFPSHLPPSLRHPLLQISIRKVAVMSLSALGVRFNH